MTHPKVWFVTGASRGFGRIWAEASLERGDKVIATARDADDLADLSSRFRDSVLVLPLDVTDRDAVFAAIATGHRHFGRIDVVINCAGYGYMGAIEELAPQEVRANFETNVFGTLSVMQAAIPIMRAQNGGHILTVSSIGGIISFPTGSPYAATKFAIEALSESLAAEVGAFGIKVTIIEPGSFATTFGSSVRHATPMPEYDALRQATRAGFKPEDVGDPSATAGAILQVVDADNPPLRLVLGATTIPKFRAVYEQRLKNWDDWSEVSIAAHG